MSILLSVFIVLGTVVDVIIKVLSYLDAKLDDRTSIYNLQDVTTRNGFAWRVVSWLTPFSWALYEIHKLYKKFKSLEP